MPQSFSPSENIKRKKELERKETFLSLRAKGIKLFKEKNNLDAFFVLEKAYNVLLDREDIELEDYLLESAYKGIWSSYNGRLFELMEYLSVVSIRLLLKRRKDMPRLAKAYNGRSLALYSLGKPSIEYNQKASLIFKEIIENKDKIYTKAEIKNAVKSKIKNDFGIIINLARDNDINRASALSDGAIELSKEYNLYIEEALSYKVKGNLFFFFGKYALSFDYLFKSRSILSSKNTKEARRKLLYTSLLICENYFRLKSFEEGFKFLSEAANLLTKETKTAPYIFYALWGDYYDKYKKDRSRATLSYKKAVEILNVSRWSIFSETNTDAFLKYKDKEVVYLKLLRNLIEEKEIVMAFFYLEQFRAKVFMEKVLLGREAKLSLSRTIIEERKEITGKLKDLYQDLDNDFDSDETYDMIKSLSDKLYYCDERLISSSLNLASNTDFLDNDAKYSLELEQIEDSLNEIPSSTIIISYVYYDDYVYIFLSYGGSLEVVSKSVDIDIEALLSDYLAIIKKPEKTDTEGIELGYYKEQVSSIFISPINDYIDDKDEVIIIPFKSLHLFPLHNFILEIKEDILVSYLPNFSSIDYLNKSILTLSTPILLIGDPRNDLAGAREEVRSIGNMFTNSSVLIGSDASKSAVLESLQRYNIVHYSGHIRFDNNRPLYSFLELAGSEEEEDGSSSYSYEGEGLLGEGLLEEGEREDISLLFLGEIYSLDLSNIDFLSLSGCSSGLGRYYLGEELVGLLKGFFYAGVRSILSTFWDIDDRSSRDFTEAFFKETLASGGNKKIGFNRAYKSMRKKYKDIFFYGGFGLYEGL